MCVCAPLVCLLPLEVRRGHQTPQTGVTEGGLEDTTQVLGDEYRSPAGATSALNWGAKSPGSFLSS